MKKSNFEICVEMVITNIKLIDVLNPLDYQTSLNALDSNIRGSWLLGLITYEEYKLMSNMINDVIYRHILKMDIKGVK